MKIVYKLKEIKPINSPQDMVGRCFTYRNDLVAWKYLNYVEDEDELEYVVIRRSNGHLTNRSDEDKGSDNGYEEYEEFVDGRYVEILEQQVK